MPKPPKIKLSRLKYFPIQQHWGTIGPIYKSWEAAKIWIPNMIEYAEQRGHENGYKFTYDPDRYELPMDFDSCDWRFNRAGRRGPNPHFWDYVCHSACHWLVDLSLYVAMTAFPQVPWRIVSHDSSRRGGSHSTIWNGDCNNPVLFDANFLALDVKVKEAWKIVSAGRMLKPGKRLRPWATLET